MEDKRTILIVEDDKYIINFISMSLKKENYRYYAAKSVEEAVSLFYANQPDLIILDLGLPDGDGIEVIERVREKSQIPIIVVSARQEEQEKIRALDMGADDYVTKPFYMGELMARIRVAMRKHIQVPGSQMKEDVFTCDYLSVDGHRAYSPGGFYFHLNHRIMKKTTKEVSAYAVSKMFRPDGDKPNQNTPCMGG